MTTGIWQVRSSAARGRDQNGGAILEMAIALPILMLILLGTADFGRVFHDSIAVQNASRMGAQYAVVTASSTAAPDLAGVQAAALAELPDQGGATASATQYCQCGNGAQNDCSSSCASKTKYISVSVTKNFTTVVPYPGVPSPVVLSSSVTVRLQ